MARLDILIRGARGALSKQSTSFSTRGSGRPRPLQCPIDLGGEGVDRMSDVVHVDKTDGRTADEAGSSTAEFRYSAHIFVQQKVCKTNHS